VRAARDLHRARLGQVGISSFRAVKALQPMGTITKRLIT
jgi:hypothetical protein